MPHPRGQVKTDWKGSSVAGVTAAALPIGLPGADVNRTAAPLETGLSRLVSMRQGMTRRCWTSRLSMTWLPVARKTVCRGNSGVLFDRPQHAVLLGRAGEGRVGGTPTQRLTGLEVVEEHEPVAVSRFRNSSSLLGNGVRLISRPVAMRAMMSASIDLPVPGQLASNRLDSGSHPGMLRTV